MSELQPPNAQSKSQDISLEDIDRILESEDPEFAKSLEDVRSVENASDVTIDASAIDESLAGEENDEKPAGGKATFKTRIRLALQGFRRRLKQRLIQAARDGFVFLKTRPIEFLLYALSVTRVLIKESMVPIRAFQSASQLKRITALVLIAICLASVWVLLANFKGTWLPQISEPILSSFESVADHVETFQPKEEGESFYSAFPQELHEFLFPKMKVNLRRTPDSPNPMGAFEVVVVLDSKDTAIEVSDREVEFFDLLQRVFEEESFADLESKLGKARLKSHLKRELNQKLTQGWAKDISFKSFILKP